jgi:hypothetical protein
LEFYLELLSRRDFVVAATQELSSAKCLEFLMASNAI